jgi:hypothetical protein
MTRPNFTNDVSLGQLLQAAVFLASCIAGIVTYRVSETEKHEKISGQVMGLELRVSAAERDLNESRLFQNEIRNTLREIAEKIGQLRGAAGVR